jgi:hypothetical protein
MLQEELMMGRRKNSQTDAAVKGTVRGAARVQSPGQTVPWIGRRTTRLRLIRGDLPRRHRGPRAPRRVCGVHQLTERRVQLADFGWVRGCPACLSKPRFIDALLELIGLAQGSSIGNERAEQVRSLLALDAAAEHSVPQ